MPLPVQRSASTRLPNAAQYHAVAAPCAPTHGLSCSLQLRKEVAARVALLALAPARALMADEAAPLRSALARLAAVADEAAAGELLQAVAHAADSLPSEARSAACCLLLGSAGAAVLGALERIAPSETPQLCVRRRCSRTTSRVARLTRGPCCNAHADWSWCCRTRRSRVPQPQTAPPFGACCAALLGCAPSDGEHAPQPCVWPARWPALRPVWCRH